MAKIFGSTSLKMSYSLPSPPKTHLLFGTGYTYGVGCGAGPFFGVGVALTPRLSFGAGLGAGAFCGVGFAAGVVASCGSGHVQGFSTPVFYMPRLPFLERDAGGKSSLWKFGHQVFDGVWKDIMLGLKKVTSTKRPQLGL